MCNSRSSFHLMQTILLNSGSLMSTSLGKEVVGADGLVQSGLWGDISLQISYRGGTQ